MKQAVINKFRSGGQPRAAFTRTSHEQNLVCKYPNKEDCEFVKIKGYCNRAHISEGFQLNLNRGNNKAALVNSVGGKKRTLEPPPPVNNPVVKLENAPIQP